MVCTLNRIVLTIPYDILIYFKKMRNQVEVKDIIFCVPKFLGKNSGQPGVLCEVGQGRLEFFSNILKNRGDTPIPDS